MPSLTSARALVFLLFIAASVRAATPLDVWPAQVAPLDASSLQARLTAVDVAAMGLPPELGPAVRFQKIFLRILSGEAVSTWRDEIAQAANAPSSTPVGNGIREVARAWFARAKMGEIDEALRAYYRQNVKFPPALADVEATIPPELRKDPWGDAWSYQLHAPQGFAEQVAQRYQLGPARDPQLGMLDEALRNRPAPGQPWTITVQEVAGNKALEFRFPRANASVAVLQPGGKVDGCMLLYIGDHWALMAGVDQLFAVSY
jgi:hypothetical protein